MGACLPAPLLTQARLLFFLMHKLISCSILWRAASRHITTNLAGRSSRQQSLRLPLLYQCTSVGAEESTRMLSGNLMAHRVN